jgi:hypothetical protein
MMTRAQADHPPHRRAMAGAPGVHSTLTVLGKAFFSMAADQAA